MGEGSTAPATGRVLVPNLVRSFAEVGEPLRHAPFRRLWLSTFAWNFARWMEMIIIGWVVLQLTGSPWLVALTGVFRAAFMPIAGPVTGALADRIERVKLMKVAQWGNVIVVGAIALALNTGHGAYWQIVIACLWLGASWGIDFPSRRALLADLAGPKGVLPAVVLDNWTMNASRVVGPLLAGAVLALWGGAGAFAVLTLAFLLASALLSGVRGPSRPAPARRLSPWGDFTAGVKSVRRDAVVSAVLVITVVMNFFLFPYQQLLSVFAEDVFHAGPVGLGYMGAANGLGAVAGLFVLPRFRSSRAQTLSFTAGSLLACAALLLFSRVDRFTLALGLLFAIGLGTCAFGTMQSAIVLGRTPPAMRGRAMGLLTMAIGSAPLGALEMGLLVERLGAPLAVSLNAIVCGLLVAAIALRQVLHRRA